MKVKSESEVAQSCPTLSDPMDCSPPGSSTHGILQARVLEWVAIGYTLTENISNLRYADDTTLMAKSEEELKSLLMKVFPSASSFKIAHIMQFSCLSHVALLASALL